MPVTVPRGQRGQAISMVMNRPSSSMTRAALMALALGGALAGLAASPAWAQATPDENPLVQRGVPAEATAETSVIARDQALLSGQRLAYDRMAAALGLPRGIPDAQIEPMVTSLVIESERINNRSYAARLTVNFNPGRVAAAGGRVQGSPAAQGQAAGQPGTPGASPAPAAGAAVSSVDAIVRYRSFPEWVEITRRLGAAAPVARVEVMSFSGEMARLRLALRAQPPEAAEELAQSGIALAPGPIDSRPGEGWRLSLAGGR